MIRSIGKHIDMSALHAKLHWVNMNKAKWVLRHIISRIVALHLIVLFGMCFVRIINWCEEGNFPTFSESHSYWKLWGSAIVGLGVGIGVVGSIILMVASIVWIVVASFKYPSLSVWK